MSGIKFSYTMECRWNVVRRIVEQWLSIVRPPASFIELSYQHFVSEHPDSYMNGNFVHIVM